MGKERLEALKQRAAILQGLREFFIREEYLEVETPILSPRLIPESSLEVFSTEYRRRGGEPVALYLIPSPELWMKRILAAGVPRIFQLTKCFRNHEEAGPLHQPEFTMLEWYALQADYLDQAALLEGLFQYLFRKLEREPLLEFRNRRIDCHPPFLRLSMQEAFALNLGLDLARLTGLEEITACAREREVPVTDQDSWADIFHKLFLTFVEPGLPAQRPLLLCDYPCGVPTLARKKAGTPWAERWELYLAGVEVANCYSEETDGAAVGEFFAREGRRKATAVVPHPADLRFLEIFSAKLPPCAGVALGVDRLVMAFTGQETIQGVNYFSFVDIFDD